MSQIPRIVKSPLSKHWFVLTRYVEKRGVDAKTGDDVAYLKALTKHDVTDQMVAILKAHHPRPRARKAAA